MTEYTAIPLNRWTEADRLELARMFFEGEEIYLRFTDQNEMREGSIAVLKEWSYLEYATKKNGAHMDTRGYRYRGRYHTANVKTLTIGTDTYEIDLADLTSFFGRVKWNGRKNECEASYHEVEWLKGYKGPCVWNYGKKEKPKVQAYDRLGRELNVGDFACYILHHFGPSYGASTQFGTITKIDNDGTVWAKNIALGGREKSEVKKINDNATIVILTKDLMDRLMMAKLAAI